MMVLGLVLATSASFAGVAQAMEMTDDAMMKKDAAMMQKETMIKDLMKQVEALNALIMVEKDKMMKKGGAMMSGDAMMEKKDAMMGGDSMMMEDDLYEGSRGDGVAKLQMFLEEKAFLVVPAGVAKGYFGAITKAALMKYQASVGVRATGYFGPLSRAAWKKHMGGDAMMEKKGDAMMEKKGDAMMEKKTP